MRLFSTTAFAYAITLALGCAIAYFTLSPPGGGGSSMPFTDKQLHFAAFAALVLPLGWVLPHKAVRIGLAALIFGGAIEIIQPTVGRTAEWADFLADGLGIVAGLMAGQVRRRFGRVRPA